MSLTNMATLQTQYATSARLETRISIHARYSRNRQPFGEWISSHYALQPGERVLELGCGTGSMWQGVVLPDGCELTLTDLSEGMLETAKANLAHLPAAYAVVDAQTLPYADASFDVVIANMMLYHVPDIGRAIGEIRRVLKAGGRFFAATFGEHGVTEAVLEMLGIEQSANHRFTLQNGAAQLGAAFAQVERLDREDALDVTDLSDLIAYLRSMQQMSILADVPDETLLQAFRAHQVNGVLSLPKEYGLFICK
ncbi:MAG: methyltransferase domain-containing protein [Clostridia bacterium]|nr:methyltransferase domain-containing protein [Clostridia bacterium]